MHVTDLQKQPKEQPVECYIPNICLCFIIFGFGFGFLFGFGPHLALNSGLAEFRGSYGMPYLLHYLM